MTAFKIYKDILTQHPNFIQRVDYNRLEYEEYLELCELATGKDPGVVRGIQKHSLKQEDFIRICESALINMKHTRKYYKATVYNPDDEISNRIYATLKQQANSVKQFMINN